MSKPHMSCLDVDEIFDNPVLRLSVLQAGRCGEKIVVVLIGTVLIAAATRVSEADGIPTAPTDVAQDR